MNIILKSVRVHFAPGINKSIPLEFHLNCIVVAYSMLHIMGKMLKEACAARAAPVRFMCHCYQPSQHGSLEKDCSCLIYFSTSIGLALDLNLESMSASSHF